MSISNIITLLCGVAMFLFGMDLMGNGLKKVAGSKMELILFRLSSTPIRGVLFGTGVTAIIQSSSATSVMVVGFVNSGMMKVNQAIGIIMGAIIGTSVTGWILCLSTISGTGGWIELLSTTTITGVVALIGIVFLKFSKNQTKKHVGDIMMGFAVLMIGMQTMSGAVAILKSNEAFISFLTKFTNPVIGILFGILLTSAIQSASAAVGILQALSVTGAISFASAFPLIMGIAVGAAVPVLISAIGANTNGKRTAFVYLFIDMLGAIIWATVFYSVNAFAHFEFLDMTMNAFSIAVLNTVFRILTVIVLLPFINILEKQICRIIKIKPEEEAELAELRDIDRLEDRFISYPSLAIEQSMIAMKSMAVKAGKNVFRAIRLLYEYRDDKFDKVQRTEDVIDKYEDKLGTYLIKISQNELNHAENKEISKLLHTISDFERIADHAVNISEAAKEIHEKHIEFSPSAQHELDVIRDAVIEITSESLRVFEENDVASARMIEPLEEWIDELQETIKMNHVKRVQAGECSLEHGFVFNDLLSDYERVADHCSNIALALIELESDEFDTHQYVIDLMDQKAELFQNALHQYQEKYKL